MMRFRSWMLSSTAVVAVILAAALTGAQTVQPPFDADYTLHDLGPVPELPLPYGGLTFLPGDPNTLLIGGGANYSYGEIYSVGVVRDASSHVTGFSGTATFFCDGAYNDGGLDWGPGNVLFYTRYPVNEIGQVRWSSTTTDKIVNLGSIGVTQTPGALAFVPAGHPGAGQLKMCSWPGGDWYDLSFSSDGTGTFDITSATYRVTIPGGPEGFVYPPTGSPDFPLPSMLVSDYSSNRVSAYEIDSIGNPIVSSRVDFITGLDGAEGALIDPLTGDFLFSTWGTGTDRVFAVRGFAAPEPIEVAIPTLGGPGLAAFVVVLLAAGLLVIWRRYG